MHTTLKAFDIILLPYIKKVEVLKPGTTKVVWFLQPVAPAEVL